MPGRAPRPFIRIACLIGGPLAFMVAASAPAGAEKAVWPWQSGQGSRYHARPQAPAYRPAPETPSRPVRVAPATTTTTRSQTVDPPYRPVDEKPSVQTTTRSQPAEPPYRPVDAKPPVHTTTTSMPQSKPIYPASERGSSSSAQPQPAPQGVSNPAPRPAALAAPAQPASNEPQRRPQTLGSSAASAQAATACMNERKSASVDAAIKSCDSVIDEALKNLANAYYFRGTAKFGKSDFDGAIGDYGQALRLDPSDADYLNSRAAVYEAKNDTAKALADYDLAIKANPKSAFAYNSRGAAFQRKGDYARAAADYGEVTKLQPDNIDAWSARCWVRALAPGQTQMALADCNAALKLKADSADVFDTRGFIHLKLGQPDNAIKDYDAALKLDPRQAGSLYGRGLAKHRKGDRSASEDMAAAKQIKPDIAEEFARYGVRP